MGVCSEGQLNKAHFTVKVGWLSVQIEETRAYIAFLLDGCIQTQTERGPIIHCRGIVKESSVANCDNVAVVVMMVVGGGVRAFIETTIVC